MCAVRGSLYPTLNTVAWIVKVLSVAIPAPARHCHNATVIMSSDFHHDFIFYYNTLHFVSFLYRVNFLTEKYEYAI